MRRSQRGDEGLALEFMARHNLMDLLWQTGRLDEAVAGTEQLVAEVRVRPAAYIDMAILYANRVGMLSEIGRIDEASKVANEALSPMRRAEVYFIEEWVYLFWRRGQIDIAALLLGASDERRRPARTGQPLQAGRTSAA